MGCWSTKISGSCFFVRRALQAISFSRWGASVEGLRGVSACEAFGEEAEAEEEMADEAGEEPGEEPAEGEEMDEPPEDVEEMPDEEEPPAVPEEFDPRQRLSYFFSSSRAEHLRTHF